MAASQANKQAYGLINFYVKLYTSQYGQAPVLNRFKEKWAFQDMADDLGYDRAKDVIQFYFSQPHFGHPISYLTYNYDQLSNLKTELDEDLQNRQRIRELTRLRVEEWKRTHGNTRSENDQRSIEE